MSIVDVNNVDGIGTSEDGKVLSLLITDHLDWTNEYEHLKILQDKINSYISYLESGQQKEIYPEQEFISYYIEIHFKHKASTNCLNFIKTVNKQLEDYNIKIEAIYEG